MEDVGINHRGEQIVGRGDGVEVAREVDVDLLARNDLRFAPASCSAFQSKNWAH